MAVALHVRLKIRVPIDICLSQNHRHRQKRRARVYTDYVSYQILDGIYLKVSYINDEMICIIGTYTRPPTVVVI